MWLEAQFQIATTCLLGGLTNTVVLASGSSGFDVHYESIIPTISRHDLQHGIDNSANWTAIAAVTRKHVELIANLARTLAATPRWAPPGRCSITPRSSSCPTTASSTTRPPPSGRRWCSAATRSA